MKPFILLLMLVSISYFASASESINPNDYLYYNVEGTLSSTGSKGGQCKQGNTAVLNGSYSLRCLPNDENIYGNYTWAIDNSTVSVVTCEQWIYTTQLPGTGSHSGFRLVGIPNTPTPQIYIMEHPSATSNLKYNIDSSGFVQFCTGCYSLNAWHFLKIKSYTNGSVHVAFDHTTTFSYPLANWMPIQTNVFANSGAGLITNVDDIVCYAGEIRPQEDELPPSISSINLTSEIPADTTEPYTTSDATPTFKFMTNENAWCRISDTNESYTSMTTQCSGGEGNISHTCTLSIGEVLNSGTDYVYLACNDSYNNYHAVLTDNEELVMNITSVSGSDAQTAIAAGIAGSLASGATIYTDKQVYLRALDGIQYYGTFDKVAVLGSKRWLFNYISAGESSISAPSLDSTVFVWENSSLTAEAIALQVSSYINATY